MNKKIDNKNKKPNSYQPLVLIFFIFIFIVIPLLLIWMFGTKDMQNPTIQSAGLTIGLTFAISIVALGFNVLFYFLKILNLRSFNFSIPTISVFCFMIFTSYSSLAIYIRVIIAFFVVVSITLFTNYIMGKIEDYKYNKIAKNKQSKEKNN